MGEGQTMESALFVTLLGLSKPTGICKTMDVESLVAFNWVNTKMPKIKFKFKSSNQPYQSSLADVYSEESNSCVGGNSLSNANAPILGSYK